MNTYTFENKNKSFQARLLAWYDMNARALPWRAEPTPYRVMVSEFMLQQTRAETAASYFIRFIREIPDIPSLAGVSDERLMKLWEGLGYYRRAINLKRAAGEILRLHGGRIPSDVRALRALPGFGEYTAGAVASIAFGHSVPAVDGNVLRVAARLLCHGGDIGSNAV